MCYNTFAPGRFSVYGFFGCRFYAVLITLVYAAVGSLLGATGFGVFLMFLIEGFFMTGVAVISMKLVHGGKEIDFNDLLFAKDRVGAAMLLGLMRNLFILLWTLLFIVPGIIKRYAYSQSYYLSLRSTPNGSGKPALPRAKR